MATFTSSSHTFVSPHPPFLTTHFTSRRGFSSSSSCFVAANQGKKGNSAPLKLNLVRGSEKKRVCCWCNKEGYNDADLALEAEILEFMRKSEKPQYFPTKKELMDGGRMDLVQGIKRQGGWLAMGWDSDDDDDDTNKDNGFQQNGFQQNGVNSRDYVAIRDKEWDYEAIHERVQSEDESCSETSFALHSPSSSASSL